MHDFIWKHNYISNNTCATILVWDTILCDTILKNKWYCCFIWTNTICFYRLTSYVYSCTKMFTVISPLDCWYNCTKWYDFMWYTFWKISDCCFIWTNNIWASDSRTRSLWFDKNVHMLLHFEYNMFKEST